MSMVEQFARTRKRPIGWIKTMQDQIQPKKTDVQPIHSATYRIGPIGGGFPKTRDWLDARNRHYRKRPNRLGTVNSICAKEGRHSLLLGPLQQIERGVHLQLTSDTVYARMYRFARRCNDILNDRRQYRFLASGDGRRRLEKTEFSSHHDLYRFMGMLWD